MGHFEQDRNWADDQDCIIGGASVPEILVPEALGDAMNDIILDDQPALRFDDLDDLPKKPKESQNFLAHAVELFKSKGIRAAPVSLFFGICVGVYGPVWNELTKIRVCEVVYNHSSEFCERVGKDIANVVVDNEIRTTTTDYLMYGTLLSAVPSVIFSFFIGPWSDRHGRKVPMACSILGFILSCAVTIPLSYVKVNPLYFLFASVLFSILGGWPVLISSINSYIGDHTDEESRSPTIAITMAGIGGGQALGLKIGTAVLDRYGLTYGFPVALFIFLGLNCASLLYVLIVIRDHDDFNNTHNQMSNTSKACGIFRIQNLKEIWEMLRRKRIGGTRFHIVLLLGAYMAMVMCLENESNILQQLTEYQPIGWTVGQYGSFSSAQGIASIISLTVAIPILKRVLKLRDTAVGIISSLSAISCSYGYAIAVVSWMVYAAMACGLLRQLSFISCQSVLISMVERSEVGKIMSIVGIIQSLSQIIGVVLFLKIFAATSIWWPGFVLAVQAFILVFPLIAFCTVNATTVYQPPKNSSDA